MFGVSTNVSAAKLFFAKLPSFAKELLKGVWGPFIKLLVD